MHNKLLWISLVDQAVVVCPSILVLVPCTRSSAVPCHHKKFPTISTRRKLRLQSYSLPEGDAPTPSHRWRDLSHLSQLWEVLFYSSVLLLVRPTYWGGMEVLYVIVETPVCCVFLRIVPIFCCLISFFIIPYIHTLPLSPQHERQHILRVSMTWILVQPWIFTCLLFLCFPLFTLLEWWYKPAFSSFHHFLRIVTT